MRYNTLMKYKLLAITLLLAAGCSVQKMYTSFSDWDSNRNTELDRQEFANAYVNSNYFSKWSKGKSSIGYDELYATVFRSVDADSTEAITKPEFDDTMKRFYFGLMRSSFSDWDKNTDETITRDEFTTHVGSTNLSSLWDANGDRSISEREMAAGMFYKCDTNNNGLIDENEFIQWKRAR